MDALEHGVQHRVPVQQRPGPGTTANVINFNYRDGWFFSLGAECRLLPATTLRAGLGYEVSPVRGTLGFMALPEANTTSLSVGMSQKVYQGLTFDIAYSHRWISDQLIVVGPGNPDQAKLLTLIPGLFNTWGGSTSSHSDVVSASLRYAFDPPPPPLIVKAKSRLRRRAGAPAASRVADHRLQAAAVPYFRH